jgi:glycine/D-amino acid oxidase-like deaminating enzyme
MFSSDVIVIGGGLVGTAVAYGLGQLGKNVTVLDEGDDVFRASRGNFGLIWVHGLDGFLIAGDGRGIAGGPGQSLHALRHGPLPGPPLRPHRHRAHRT